MDTMRTVLLLIWYHRYKKIFVWYLTVKQWENCCQLIELKKTQLQPCFSLSIINPHQISCFIGKCSWKKGFSSSNEQNEISWQKNETESWWICLDPGRVGIEVTQCPQGYRFSAKTMLGFPIKIVQSSSNSRLWSIFPIFWKLQ